MPQFYEIDIKSTETVVRDSSSGKSSGDTSDNRKEKREREKERRTEERHKKAQHKEGLRHERESRQIQRDFINDLLGMVGHSRLGYRINRGIDFFNQATGRGNQQTKGSLLDNILGRGERSSSAGGGGGARKPPVVAPTSTSGTASGSSGAMGAIGRAAGALGPIGIAVAAIAVVFVATIGLTVVALRKMTKSAERSAEVLAQIPGPVMMARVHNDLLQFAQHLRRAGTIGPALGEFERQRGTNRRLMTDIRDLVVNPKRIEILTEIKELIGEGLASIKSILEVANALNEMIGTADATLQILEFIKNRMNQDRTTFEQGVAWIASFVPALKEALDKYNESKTEGLDKIAGELSDFLNLPIQKDDNTKIQFKDFGEL